MSEAGPSCRLAKAADRLEVSSAATLQSVSSDSLAIRPAIEGDAPAIASIHVRGWQWAYRGQLPDAVLDGLTATLDRRESAWRDTVARSSAPSAEERVWVAEAAGRVVGFASTGLSRDADAAPGTAELYAIYLDPVSVGTGVGRALFAHATEDLRQRGYPAATLWVLESNSRARRFYEAAGWRTDGATKTEQRPGFALHEVRYRTELTTAAQRHPQVPHEDGRVQAANKAWLIHSPSESASGAGCRPDRGERSPEFAD